MILANLHGPQPASFNPPSLLSSSFYLGFVVHLAHHRYTLPQDVAEKYGASLFMLQGLARTCVRDIDPQVCISIIVPLALPRLTLAAPAERPVLLSHRHEEVRDHGGAALWQRQIHRCRGAEGQGLHAVRSAAQAWSDRITFISSLCRALHVLASGAGITSCLSSV